MLADLRETFARLAASAPAAGTFWRDRESLRVVAVTGRCLRREDLTPVVVYRAAGGECWCDTEAGFLGRFDPA